VASKTAYEIVVGDWSSDVCSSDLSNIGGGNYGWPMRQQVIATNQSSIKPIKSYYYTNTPTQIIYYSGNRYPELKDNFIAGSFRGDLYVYKIGEDGKKLLQETKIITSLYPSKEVVGISVSPGGEIFFGAYDIFKLNTLDHTSSEKIMFPIIINATNIKVSSLDYTENTMDLKVGLKDSHDLSTVSIKVPNSLFDVMNVGQKCQSVSNNSMSNVSGISGTCNIKIQKDKEHSLVLIQLSAGTPKSLHFIIGKNTSILDY